MTKHNGWPRILAAVLLAVQALFALITLALAGADIARTRAYITSRQSSLYYYDYGSGVEAYPYAFTALMVSLLVLISAIITFILVIVRRAVPGAVGGVNIVWILFWLGLWGYGCYLWSNYASVLESACQSRYSSDDSICGIIRTEFAWFIFCIIDFVIAIAVCTVAFHANTRERRARYGIPQYARYAPTNQGYPATPAAAATASHMSQGHMSQSFAPPPPQQWAGPVAPPQPVSSPPPSHAPLGVNSAQPFFQNGRWYSYQAVPMPDGQQHQSMQMERSPSGPTDVTHGSETVTETHENHVTSHP
ncbi:MAG: hypothetical protein M1833_003745 [Piccolia ochrophora]|nr:MAG: hypothetical protein M1833_003745 [Piccolia ochrophora]